MQTQCHLGNDIAAAGFVRRQGQLIAGHPLDARFNGFVHADPFSLGHEAAPRIARRLGACFAWIANGSPASGQALTEVADVDFIHAQDGLQETASELRALTRSLKGDDKFIWLQGKAKTHRKAMLAQMDTPGDAHPLF